MICTFILGISLYASHHSFWASHGSGWACEKLQASVLFGFFGSESGEDGDQDTFPFGGFGEQIVSILNSSSQENSQTS
jgi:hypothetical protein